MKTRTIVVRFAACLFACAIVGHLTSQEPGDKRIVDARKNIDGGSELLAMPKLVAPDGVPTGDWSKLFAWRSIGPANMGGRITGLAVVASDPSTYYVATGSGGLLKTTNNGSTFEHQFDRESAVSIGAVAVAPTDRNAVWVGTGEANPRNSVSFGDGVYLSTDGGKSWKNKGLTKSFQIGKIIVHPKDPKTVYVAALGRLYGPSEERGLYKTTDGGATWERILFVDDKTGVMDLVMHPTNPDIMIAAAWERQRDEFDSFRGSAKFPPAGEVYGLSKIHGSGSGLFRTTDGGKTWTKLKQGLPQANLGRVGLDWHRNNPNLVFAIIDTDKAGKGLPISKAYLGLTPTATAKGLVVESVTADGPAAKGGVAKGDLILTIDAKDVKTAVQLTTYLATRKVGDKLQIALMRGEEKKSLDVTLLARPTEDPTQRGTLGFQTEEADGGLLVSSVTEGGPADRAMLKVDDLLVSMDGVKLDATRTYLKLLTGKKTGDTVKILYQRAGEKKEVDVAVEAPQLGDPGRPYAGRLAGQRENQQDLQGPEGEHTGGIYKSTDGGVTWTRVNSLNERPWYFSVVRIDPSDEKIIYALGVTIFRSVDGGKTFAPKDINKGVHSDQHDLWINPKDGKHILVGTDGGTYVSYDRAANWEHLNHMALGQFYHVTVDDQTPYNVYGGLQDNGTWGGPSRTFRPGGPTNPDYRYVNGGDGFVCRVDAVNPDLIYGESQDGSLMRRNLKTNESAPIRPKAQLGTSQFRFNWNTPFILSHSNSSIYYCAANYVFRSTDRGNDLKIVSQEIARTKRGSATALAESPKNADVLWVGSDDGAVWVTKDGCKNWTNVTDNFKAAGLPGPRWVSSIEPSKTVAGRCYVAFDAHRSNDDDPYVFVTEDFGQTWKSLRGNLPAGSTRVLREDIVNPNLLYLGAEFGIHASINRGQSWFKIHGTALPTVAVHEIAQATTEPEIVAGTHGRSLWVMNVKTLRQLKPDQLADANSLWAPSALTQWRLDSTHEDMFKTGTRVFAGQNPPRVANIDFVLAKKPAKMSLTITDIEGRTVREFDLSKENGPGFHRIAWDLTGGDGKKDGKGGGGKGAGGGGGGGGKKGGGDPAGKGGGGQLVKLPGTFRVHLDADGQILSQTLVVEADPRFRPGTSDVDAAEEDRQLRRQFDRLTPSLEP